jgi:N-acetyl-anhydromuramyl-L-alanine amidase AmpD
MDQVRKATNYIVVHCSATKAKQTNVDAKEIDRWHRQRGWLMIGYHFVVTRDATLQKGRDLNAAGAHVAGHNHESIGVCLVGGISNEGAPEDNFTKEQKDVLHALLREMRALYPKARIIGHYELEPKKACPSFDVQQWLKDKPELKEVQ